MKPLKIRLLCNLLLILVLLLAAPASIHAIQAAAQAPGPLPAPQQPDPPPPCASPSDDCWRSGFHLPGVTGTVNAMVQDSLGNIYVGGEIIAAGGMPVNNLARWDGVRWWDLGGGVTHTNTSWVRVYALAVDASNNLYVGGVFDHAGAVAANNLARWNGANWEAVGGGVTGSVMALETVSGGMYVGGYFSQAGTISANNIAYRDFQTASWLPLGSGVDDAIYAMEYEPTSSSLFAGGDFGTAGGVEAIRLARYTGGGVWTAVGGGLLNSGGRVNTLLQTPRDGGGFDLYVGGAFPQVGYTVYAQNIARWDGSTWYPLDYGTDAEVKALLITPAHELIVAGHFTSVGSDPVSVDRIAKWDGSAWSASGGWSGRQ